MTIQKEELETYVASILGYAKPYMTAEKVEIDRVMYLIKSREQSLLDRIEREIGIKAYRVSPDPEGDPYINLRDFTLDLAKIREELNGS